MLEIMLCTPLSSLLWPLSCTIHELEPSKASPEVRCANYIRNLFSYLSSLWISPAATLGICNSRNCLLGLHAFEYDAASSQWDLIIYVITPTYLSKFSLGSQAQETPLPALPLSQWPITHHHNSSQHCPLQAVHTQDSLCLCTSLPLVEENKVMFFVSAAKHPGQCLEWSRNVY